MNSIKHEHSCKILCVNSDELASVEVIWSGTTFSAINILFSHERTSDSLKEGLPIKMTREKFQRKWYFFYEKESRFNTRLIHKKPFSHWTSTNWKIWVENSVFANQHIENRKSFTEVLFETLQVIVKSNWQHPSFDETMKSSQPEFYSNASLSSQVICRKHNIYMYLGES